tara:strand:- start:7535 stop:8350 length:816 start_codon:yes stop_codon:yes gene_type:complete
MNPFRPTIYKFLILGICFIFFWVGCTPKIVERENFFDVEVIEIGSATTLTVKTFNGGITLRPSTDGKIHVKSVFRQPKQIDYSIENTENEIKIVAKVNVKDVRPIPGATLDIKLPKSLQLRLTNNNGPVVINYVESDAKINVTDGSVSINKSKGSYDIEVKRGDIFLEELEGNVKARNNGGDIELKNATKEFGFRDLKANSGNIYLTLDDKSYPQVSIQASTNNGSITNLSLFKDSNPNRQKFTSIYDGSASSIKATTKDGSIEIDSYYSK